MLAARLNLYGMLAVAHLGGVGNLKRFLLDGYDPDDKSTSLCDYAALFSSKLQDNDFFFSLATCFNPCYRTILLQVTIEKLLNVNR